MAVPGWHQYGLVEVGVDKVPVLLFGGIYALGSGVMYGDCLLNSVDNLV